MSVPMSGPPMSTSQPQASSSPDIQEHVVRVPRERKKKYSMMKIGSGVELDFSKLHSAQTSVRIERENNFKEFKNAYDIDTMPKFGAGSEYGRQQKEEARRKKYGIRVRKYNPEDQPWMLKIGQGKNIKKYKGVREGTISDNTSYYIFTKCTDGAFEAVPVEEWYNYTPQIRYKYLNSEEAEEEFSRRDKTLNLFNIMVKRRVRNDAGEGEEEAGEKLPKGGKKKKDFTLTDMDDWAALSDEEDDDDEDEDEDAPKKKPAKGKGKAPKKKSKNSKHNSDDEAIEESDEGDYDDREVDYMSDSGMSSSESEMGEKEKGDKYEEKGVDEEAGLRKLIDSEEEDEDEEEKDDDNEDDKDKDGKGKKNGSDSDSSSSSSESDSDIEKDDKISSALFMQKGSEKKKERTASPKPDERGTKRKIDGESSGMKKPRTDSPLTTQGGGGASEGITEDAIRRYLMRKPMTTKDLLQKFRSKKLNMTNDQMTHTIAQLLKRINPEKKIINKVMYLSLKTE